jgi:hypothetical protein
MDPGEFDRTVQPAARIDLRLRRASANATAPAPAGTRSGLDASFTTRHTASATSSAWVTSDRCLHPIYRPAARAICAAAVADCDGHDRETGTQPSSDAQRPL